MSCCVQKFIVKKMAHHHLWILLFCLQTCRLGKPKITQSFVTSVNSTCNATLMCSVDKEEKNVTYSWSPRGEAGNVLQIFQTPDNQEETYTCTAWNPVSNNSDSISAQQLCTDITMSPHIHRTGLMSGLAVLSLLIIILSVVLFLLCKKEVLHLTISQKDGPDYYILNGLPNMFLGSAGCHGSRTWVQVCVSSFLNNFSKNPDASSKKTIYTYITVSRKTQAAESRIYDEIPQSKVLPTKEEPVNTIYSMMQYSDKMEKTSTQNSKPLGTSCYEIVI
ncbi:SLAM family member 5 isoform X8 [Ovis canadensis]|uniref:SLAM family member 5 isoform X8 n=1 Tax=Ovis canadensis TaxID=37174 RepID=UPI003751AE12